MTPALAQVRLDELVRYARACNASDVHLAPGVPCVLRVDGGLTLYDDRSFASGETQVIAGSLLGETALAVFAARGDATVTRHLAEFGALRIHAFRTARGTGIAIRLLAREIPALDVLHLPPVIGSFAEKPHGLLIFAGPTGSGKSTALAALVNTINRTQTRHILTIEDPIEYEYANDRSLVNQREVGRDTPDFEAAVSGALRSDPDVIVIGEMRDAETMHAALTAAETGHLVITTLHTGDAAQTVDRIVGAFDGRRREHVRMQLSQTLVGVVCLRLLPRAGGRGRIGAAEVLVANDAVRSLIRDGKTHQLRNVISTNRQIGMQTLESHLSALILRGEVTLHAARLVTERPEELRTPETAPA